jgi:hypothetical protein
MDFWTLFEYAAWAVSFVLFAWMAMDFMRVNRDFSEDLLTSSREGEIEAISERHDLK